MNLLVAWAVGRLPATPLVAKRLTEPWFHTRSPKSHQNQNLQLRHLRPWRKMFPASAIGQLADMPLIVTVTRRWKLRPSTHKHLPTTSSLWIPKAIPSWPIALLMTLPPFLSCSVRLLLFMSTVRWGNRSSNQWLLLPAFTTWWTSQMTCHMERMSPSTCKLNRQTCSRVTRSGAVNLCSWRVCFAHWFSMHGVSF